MLDQLRARYDSLPSPKEIDRDVAGLCQRLARLGVFNMLMSDGRTLYAFCSKKLSCLTRRAPFGKATLIDDDRKVNFAEETGPNDCVTVVATGPLTSDEDWTAIPPGTLLALRDGIIAASLFSEPLGRQKSQARPRSAAC
jgi:glutamine amidotransferase